jgi:hypothetical protein
VTNRSTVQHFGLAGRVGGCRRVHDDVVAGVLDHCHRGGEGESAGAQRIQASLDEWDDGSGILTLRGCSYGLLLELVEAIMEVLRMRKSDKSKCTTEEPAGDHGGQCLAALDC